MGPRGFFFTVLWIVEPLSTAHAIDTSLRAIDLLTDAVEVLLAFRGWRLICGALAHIRAPSTTRRGILTKAGGLRFM